jgi:hypothetical protein
LLEIGTRLESDFPGFVVWYWALTHQNCSIIDIQHLTMHFSLTPCTYHVDICPDWREHSVPDTNRMVRAHGNRHCAAEPTTRLRCIWPLSLVTSTMSRVNAKGAGDAPRVAATYTDTDVGS